MPTPWPLTPLYFLLTSAQVHLWPLLYLEILLYTAEDGSKGQNKHPVQHQTNPAIIWAYLYVIAGCNHMIMQMQVTDISRCSEVLMSVNYAHLNL